MVFFFFFFFLVYSFITVGRVFFRRFRKGSLSFGEVKTIKISRSLVIKARQAYIDWNIYGREHDYTAVVVRNVDVEEMEQNANNTRLVSLCLRSAALTRSARRVYPWLGPLLAVGRGLFLTIGFGTGPVPTGGALVLAAHLSWLREVPGFQDISN